MKEGEKAVDEAFVMANYSQLEPLMRRRMRVEENAHRDPPNNVYPLNHVYPPNSVYPPSKVYPPNNVYPPNHVYPLNSVYPPSDVYPPNNMYPLSNVYPLDNVYPLNHVYLPNNVYPSNNMYPSSNACPLEKDYNDSNNHPTHQSYPLYNNYFAHQAYPPGATPYMEHPHSRESSSSLKKQTKTYLAINEIKRREVESVRAFVSRYTDKTVQITRLNKDQMIAGFVHGVKIKFLVKLVSVELPESYDGLIDKAYSWLQAEEIASDGRPITFMDGGIEEKPPRGKRWEGAGKKNKEKRDRYNPYKESILAILQNLTKTPREIMFFEKVGKTFLKPPEMVSNARETSKYCEFHQDYGHEMNACREWKSQIKEAINSEKLSHLVKGIRKGFAK
nr:hypothetical protein [Tanacetum cinerariifolium]